LAVLSNTVEGSVRSEGMVAFLKYALASIAGKVIVVLDNTRIHHSKLVKDFLALEPQLEVVHSPPYAPEANPVECCGRG
jgi:putative transposase